MGTMASQVTNPTIAYSTLYWGADQRNNQSSASQAFVFIKKTYVTAISLIWANQHIKNVNFNTVSSVLISNKMHSVNA